MNAPVNIHPPKNWQDFETLCLKIWGEIWNIPHEIEFNADNSQGQDGVDIYGPVEGGKAYNGVQCKNKKLNLIDGSPNRITVKDIQAEIDKAKGFKPALKKLVIATSLPKDKAIEEYVRVQSLEHVQNGLFAIQVCFWEFFERKLPEFEKVYNWYLKNEDFHRVSAITVTFNGGQAEKIYHPKFQKTINRYEVPVPNPETGQPVLPENRVTLAEALKDYHWGMPGPLKPSWLGAKVDWKQFCWLDLAITNTGQATIEDYKIELEFMGDFIKVSPEQGYVILNPKFRSDIKGYSNSNKDLYMEPFNNILVQGDRFVTSKFYLEPKVAVEAEVIIHWKLLSRDFADAGTLVLKIAPQYHTVINRHIISDPEQVRDDVSYSFVQRNGSKSIDGTRYFDKECDYTFE